MSQRNTRPAELGDAAAVADLLLRSRKAAAIPAAVHTDAEVGAWAREVLIPSSEVWLTSADGNLAGVMALDGDWVEQLYVAPEQLGRGHGTALIRLAQERRERLQLWSFQSNLSAQRFYEARGFHPTGVTSTDNEEHAPALHYRWQRTSPCGADAARGGLSNGTGKADAHLG